MKGCDIGHSRWEPLRIGVRDGRRHDHEPWPRPWRRGAERMSSRREQAISVGITNTRLNAVKRRVAVETAIRLALVADCEVCLVGADPTDRDVQRRLPDLLKGPYRRMELRHGQHAMEFTYIYDRHLAIVTLADRAVIEPVLTRVREMFPFVIVDAPSRVGRGVGIARALPPFLDALVVASPLRAGGLAEAQTYVDALAAMPSVRHLDVRVLFTSPPAGYAPEQLRRKVSRLPALDLTGGVDKSQQAPTGRIDEAIDQLVEWLLELQRARAVPTEQPAAKPGAKGGAPLGSVNANVHYETYGPRPTV